MWATVVEGHQRHLSLSLAAVSRIADTKIGSHSVKLLKWSSRFYRKTGSCPSDLFVHEGSREAINEGVMYPPDNGAEGCVLPIPGPCDNLE